MTAHRRELPHPHPTCSMSIMPQWATEGKGDWRPILPMQTNGKTQTGLGENSGASPSLLSPLGIDYNFFLFVYLFPFINHIYSNINFMSLFNLNITS
jgi:hypothetical protein